MTATGIMIQISVIVTTRDTDGMPRGAVVCPVWHTFNGRQESLPSCVPEARPDVLSDQAALKLRYGGEDRGFNPISDKRCLAARRASREFVQASARELQELCERKLGELELWRC
jgi:hypothetical protein